MDAAALAIMGLAIGLALLVAEFFIPSGGLISVLAIVVISASLWFAWQAWGESNAGVFWSYVATMVLLVPVSVGGALYLLPRTSFGRRVLLEAPSPDGLAGYTEEEKRLKSLVGRIGKTVNLLNPGGLVTVDEERFHCESPGMLIDPDQSVEVIAVKGNRLVVAPSRADSVSRDDDEQIAARPPDSTDDSGPLDFEIPRS